MGLYSYSCYFSASIFLVIMQSIPTNVLLTEVNLVHKL